MTGNKIMSITKNQLHDRIKDLQVRAYNISEKLNNAGNKEYQSNLFIHSTGNDERMDYGSIQHGMPNFLIKMNL